MLWLSTSHPGTHYQTAAFEQLPQHVHVKQSGDNLDTLSY